MLETLSPTSDEMYLRDALANLWALQEISPAETEIDVFGDQLHDGVAVFEDMKTGNRISVTPIDEGTFLGANVKFIAPDSPLEVEGLEDPISEGHFVVTSDLKVYLNEPNKDTSWRPFDAGKLAFMLDVPQIMPKAVSETDIRNLPPVIEGILPKRNTPAVLEQYFTQRINSDILRIPHEAIYTLCSGFIDDRELADPDSIGDPIVKDGVYYSDDSTDHIFQVEITEVMPAFIDDEILGFEREFVIYYQSLNGDQSMVGFLPGYEQIEGNQMRAKGEYFEFRLTREGLVFYAEYNGRKVALNPNQETSEDLLRALSSGIDLN